MSELGVRSKREAASMPREASKAADDRALERLRWVIYLRGEPVRDGVAAKVHPQERSVEVRAGDDPPGDATPSELVQ
jgi:CRISPR/Cas system-associated exonuclease Cas4 (RecB family)